MTLTERDQLSELVKIARDVLIGREMQGVFELSEDGPAGYKVEYQRRKIESEKDDLLNFLYGGVFYVCSSQKGLAPEEMLQISQRDQTVRIRNTDAVTDANWLVRAFNKTGRYNFNVMLSSQDVQT